MPNVLIAEKVHPILISALEQIGYEVHYQPAISQQDMLQIISEYEGIIIRGKLKLDNLFFQKAVNLRFIGRPGSGLENVDLKEAQQRNIEVFNSPEGNCTAVAEHCMAMLLLLIRNLNQAQSDIKNYKFLREENRGFELTDKRVGIIGYGNAGKAFTRLLQGFSCDVVAYDIDTSTYDSAITVASLHEIMHTCDVISFHCNLNETSHHLLNEDIIAHIGKNPIIINSSRGEVIKTTALIHLLEKNRIKGACLDVFENENFSTYNETEKTEFEKLKAFSNVILSPHIAGWTHESLYKMSNILFQKIQYSKNANK